MSVAQITAEIEKMTEDEQFHVAAFLQHLVNERDSNHAADLTSANQNLDAGKKTTIEELVAKHEELERSGR